MEKEFLIRRFTPVIHYANRLACRPGDRFGPRTINGYQFIYVQRGTGQLRIGCKTYRAVPGSLFHYGPGEPHLIRASEDDPFVLFGLHYLPEGELEERIPASFVKIEQLPPDAMERNGVEDGEVDKHAAYEHEAVMDEYAAAADKQTAVEHTAANEEKQMKRRADQEERVDFNGMEHTAALAGGWSIPSHLQPGLWPLPYFETFAREFAEEREAATVLMRGLFMQFIVTLLRWIRDNRPSESPLDRHVAAVRQRLEERAEENYDPSWLEQWTPYSADYISRLFRDRFGTTPHDYHAARQSLAARRLLEETTLTVTEIAQRLQFGSIHYFCKWFKRMTGEQPSAYRKRRRLL
jgi:AraC-like DNA-binding protein/quercetin dioxygenase-like cupin family protein